MKIRKIFTRLAMMGFLLAACFVVTDVKANADSTATVSVDSAYIRSSASTSGSIVGGAMKNDKLTILETTTDSAGNTWYKVQVDSDTTGYIRSDLVTTDGSVSTTTTDTTTTTSTTDTTTTTDTTPIISADLIEVAPVTGSASGDVNVRKGPSTTTAKLDSVKKGTEVTVTGYEEATDGVWYYLTYGEKTGYIRNDYVTLDGELTVKVDEPEVIDEPEPEPEEPEPEEPEVYMDYEVVYELDGNGDTVWYLNDYTEGTKNEITELISAKKELEESTAAYEKKLKKKQAGIVVLTILVILLIGAGVAAYIIFRRWYYGYDETEEPVTKKETRPVTKESYGTKAKNPDSDFKLETVGAKKTEEPKKTASGGVLLPDGHIQMPDGTIKKAIVGVRQPDGSIKLSDGRVKMPDGTITRPAESTQSTEKVSYPSEKKARNFANDDDDIEFGFLNMNSDSDEE